MSAFAGSSILVELEFEDAGFCGGRKTGKRREKPSEEAWREPTTNSTHI